MRGWFLLIISLIAGLLPSHVLAGAWVRQPGTGQVVANAVIFSGSHFFDLASDRQPQERFTKTELNPYIEYGWQEGTTLGANLFVDYVTQDTPAGQSGNDHNFGLADTELFLRHRLYEQDGIALALQPLIKLPSWFENGATPKSGDDEFAAELSLYAGYSFAWQGRYHYLEARAGYRHRFGALENQTVWEARFGYRWRDDLLIIPAIYAIRSTDLPDDATFSQSGENEYDLTKLELGTVYQLEEAVSLHGSLFNHVDGRNSGTGTGVSLGVGVAF